MPCSNGLLRSELLLARSSIFYHHGFQPDEEANTKIYAIDIESS
jgi:hypothetical protein